MNILTCNYVSLSATASVNQMLVRCVVNINVAHTNHSIYIQFYVSVRNYGFVVIQRHCRQYAYICLTVSTPILCTNVATNEQNETLISFYLFGLFGFLFAYCMQYAWTLNHLSHKCACASLVCLRSIYLVYWMWTKTKYLNNGACTLHRRCFGASRNWNAHIKSSSNLHYLYMIVRCACNL